MKIKFKTVTVFLLLLLMTALETSSGRVREAAGFTIPVPSATGTAVKNNKKAVIDYSNTKDGYIMARYAQRTSKQLRVIIKGPSGVSYTYFLWPGDYEVFPLSDGNGNYTITVYEQVSGTKYAAANTAKVKVTLSSEFAPFLCPNQYVNYSPNSQTVRMADQLSGGVPDVLGKISEVYNYVVNNFSYDKQLASTVKSGYLPKVDEVLSSKRGICFDYSAVMAAMLRSQGIPCRLVVGYAGQVYHAWINAYSKETGWVNQVIRFDGGKWVLMDPTFASSGKQSDDIMEFIGNGNNYKAKFRY